jgi:hypothetical protein
MGIETVLAILLIVMLTFAFGFVLDRGINGRDDRGREAYQIALTIARQWGRKPVAPSLPHQARSRVLRPRAPVPQKALIPRF